MAIKIKRETDAAATAGAGAAGGRARRQMELARLAQGAGARTQMTSGARSSAISPGMVSAPTIHAQATTHVAPQSRIEDIKSREEMQAREQDFRAGESEKEREFRSGEAEADRAWRTGEREAGQEFRSGEAEKEREWRTGEREGAQAHAIDLEELREDHRIDKDARDRAEWEYRNERTRGWRDEDRIDAGTHEYGYSPDAQRQIDAINKEYNDAAASGRFTPEQLAELKKAQENEIANIPKSVVRRKDPEGQFKNNTFTDENGRVWSTDGKLMYNPADAETRQREYQLKRQDMEDKRYMDAMMKLEQGYRQTQESEDMSGQKIYKDVIVPYTDEQKKAILQRLFPNRFAPVEQPTDTQEQTAQPQPTATPTETGTARPTIQPPPADATQEQRAEYAQKKWLRR